METISPLTALAGGALIRTAAAVLLLLSGRIAGVSGMLASAVRIAAFMTTAISTVALIRHVFGA